MKTLGFTCLALLLSVAVMAKEPRAAIEFTVKDCHTGETDNYNDLKLYKNGKIVWAHDDFMERGVIEVKDLDTGKYYVEYRTIFNNKEKYEVNIPAYTKYKVELCTGYLDYSKSKWEPFISLLTVDESYRIAFKTRGCFHGYELPTITVSRNKEGYTISYKEIEKKLSADDVEYLSKFEKELFALAWGGCTTHGTYTLTYKNNDVVVVDATCQWRGMSYLLQRFYPETLKKE